MSASTIDAMIPSAIKLANAKRYSQLHQSELFEFDESIPDAWRNTWDYIVERINPESEPPSLPLLKGETRSGEEETFELDMQDVDAQWFLICHHFGIEDWSLDAIAERLQEDFYGGDIQLKHPISGETKTLSEHITDFLTLYPQGGTGGIKCDLSELFTLEEI